MAAADGNRGSILIAGLAGMVAGSMSMAAGEYVSGHSQADTESADLERERAELAADPGGERRELAAIYVKRGLTSDLADQVAGQLMSHNALEAHARDELGVTDALSARPMQAALASATSFAVGASVPLLVCVLCSQRVLILAVALSSLLCLAILGGLAAQIGGASVLKGAIRVVFWGLLTMAVTLGVGKLFGTKA